jgi:hypothetical protein
VSAGSRSLRHRRVVLVLSLLVVVVGCGDVPGTGLGEVSRGSDREPSTAPVASLGGHDGIEYTLYMEDDGCLLLGTAVPGVGQRVDESCPPAEAVSMGRSWWRSDPCIYVRSDSPRPDEVSWGRPAHAEVPLTDDPAGNECDAMAESIAVYGYIDVPGMVVCLPAAVAAAESPPVQVVTPVAGDTGPFLAVSDAAADGFAGGPSAVIAYGPTGLPWGVPGIDPPPAGTHEACMAQGPWSEPVAVLTYPVRVHLSHEVVASEGTLLLGSTDGWRFLSSVDPSGRMAPSPEGPWSESTPPPEAPPPYWDEFAHLAPTSEALIVDLVHEDGTSAQDAPPLGPFPLPDSVRAALGDPACCEHAPVLDIYIDERILRGDPDSVRLEAGS